MSLVTELKVGTKYVGVIEVVRTEGSGTEPDDLNTYTYYIYRGPNFAKHDHEGQVVHRYGDGAMRLLLKALLDAERHL